MIGDMMMNRWMYMMMNRWLDMMIDGDMMIIDGYE